MAIIVLEITARKSARSVVITYDYEMFINNYKPRKAS